MEEEEEGGGKQEEKGHYGGKVGRNRQTQHVQLEIQREEKAVGENIKKMGTGERCGNRESDRGRRLSVT